MKSTNNPIDQWSVYVSGGLLSFCGVMVFSIMPLLVSAIQRRYGFRESETGDVIACYFAGVTFVSLSTVWWLRILNWRTTAMLGQTLAIAALLTTMYADNFIELALLMGLAGVGGGISYALVLTILGDSDDADRAFAINLFFQAFPVVILMLVLPRLFANDASDMRLLFMMMGTLVLVLSVGIFWLPISGIKGAPQKRSIDVAQRSSIWLPLIGVGITFLFMIGCTAPWTFIEAAAHAKGLAPVQVGYGLAAATFAALVGSVIAAWMGDRFGKALPVCMGGLVYLAGIFLLNIFADFPMFALAAFLYYLPSNFLLAFSLGITAEVDLDGRLIGLSTASVMGPSLVCPPIAGRLYEIYGFTSNLLMGAMSVIAAVALYLILLRRARHAALSRARGR